MNQDDLAPSPNDDDDERFQPSRILTQLLDPLSKSTMKDSVELLLNTYKASANEQKAMTRVILMSIENIVKQKSPEGQPIRWFYVPVMPSENVTGRCLSLDFGCSDHYFQVAVCDVFGKDAVVAEAAPTPTTPQAFRPTDIQAFLLTRTVRRADMATFCDFVAGCVRKVMQDNGLQGTKEDPVLMGVAAGFDARVKPQVSPTVASVSLTHKDYHMKGFIGADFVAKFHSAFSRAKISVKIVSVMNDSVSTLISGIHQVQHMSDSDADCSIGVISSRCGSNMSYLETDQDFLDMCSVDKRLLLRCPRGSGHCAVVNTECGMWVGKNDELADQVNIVEKYVSESLGENVRLECLSSGVWYPEQLRRCIYVLQTTGAIDSNLPDCTKLSASACYEIFTQCDHWRASRISSGVKLTEELRNLLGVESLSESDAGIIAEVCQAIVGRTAQVLANGIMALALKVYGKVFPGKMVVAYGGTMFRLSQLEPSIDACLKTMVPDETEVFLVKTDVVFGCAVSAIAAGSALPKKTPAMTQ